MPSPFEIPHSPRSIHSEQFTGCVSLLKSLSHKPGQGWPTDVPSVTVPVIRIWTSPVQARPGFSYALHLLPTSQASCNDIHRWEFLAMLQDLSFRSLHVSDVGPLPTVPTAPAMCPGDTAGISSQHPGGEETQGSPLASKPIRAGRIRGNVASGFHSRQPGPSPRGLCRRIPLLFSLTAPPAPGIQIHVLNTARAAPIRTVLKVCSARTKMAKAPLLASKALPQLPPHTCPPFPTAL